jgi:hypothetical protein
VWSTRSLHATGTIRKQNLTNIQSCRLVICIAAIGQPEPGRPGSRRASAGTTRRFQPGLTHRSLEDATQEPSRGLTGSACSARRAQEPCGSRDIVVLPSHLQIADEAWRDAMLSSCLVPHVAWSSLDPQLDSHTVAGSRAGHLRRVEERIRSMSAKKATQTRSRQPPRASLTDDGPRANSRAKPAPNAKHPPRGTGPRKALSPLEAQLRKTLAEMGLARARRVFAAVEASFEE